jgi:primosomal protein N' (replication factor Y)
VHHYSIILPTLLDDPLTYKSNLDIESGSYVVVTLRKKSVVGVVLEKQIIQGDLKFEIKNIEHILPLPPISKIFIQTFKEISNFHMEKLGIIFSLLINIVNNFWKSIITLEKIIKILEKNYLANYNYSKKTILNFINGNKEEHTQSESTKNKYIICPFTLNIYQQNALQEIENNINEKIILLEGETGSGKTLVYFEKIKHILKKDNDAQVLILLPEIALTNAILHRVEEYFGFKPFSWHSNLSQKERKENFLSVNFNIARIVVGARSAIFLPFRNLKLIIIDEEHDYSFKQEQQIFYHTIDIAKIMRKINSNLQIILSSATPSLETIYNVKIKNYTRVLLKSEKSLSERFSISIEDMNHNENRKQIISKNVLENIRKYLELGLQSMIFLNRRGYNSLIICKKCNGKLLCKNCSVGMVYFKDGNRFFCPQCNFSIEFSRSKCTTCFSEGDFKFYGYGIEKIYEMISNEFPDLAKTGKIAILSSDNSDNLQETIKKIENGEVDLIVGTQILAKGHNFPKLGFLTILDGGLNFSGVDLRSSEKTYQILHQIMGRLGRFGIKGEVIIQTHETQSLVLQALLDYNRTKFYTYEFKQRKDFNMPPFSQLFKITFSDTNSERAMKNALKFVSEFEYNSEVEILGPAPSAIIRLNKLYRHNIIIKTNNNFDLQKFLYNQLDKKELKNLKMRIDINPMNFI